MDCFSLGRMVAITKYSHKDIPGYTDDADFEFLRKVCEDAPDSGILLELGTFLGRSAIFFAETMRELDKEYEIYCLDWFWSKQVEFVNRDILLGNYDLLTPVLNSEMTCIDLVSEFCSDFPEINLIRHDIKDFIPKPLRNKRFSLVFEDSEHTYTCTTACLYNYFLRLEKNGIYCGDDYDWKEVNDAVTDFSSQFNLKVTTNEKIWRLHAA